jgi:hypothetical protein
MVALTKTRWMMANVCLVYARPSRNVVKLLHQVLARRYTVWWDDEIHSGDYRVEIERQLGASKCVVPVWCKVSRSDSDVLDEAQFAARAGKTLLPVRIEDVQPPLGFGGLHTVDLIGWNGDPDDPRIVEFLRNIERAIHSGPRLLPRPATLTVAGRVLDSPIFFRSVSSHETQLTPRAAVHALKLFRVGTVLVSAYDIVHGDDVGAIVADLRALQASGTTILLDSGNYEAFRKKDQSWSVDLFDTALAKTPHDLAISFDVLNPAPDIDLTVRGILAAVKRDSRKTMTPVAPVVHVPKDANGTLRVDLVPEVMKRIARELRPALLTIPERELGDGLVYRARVVFEIRKKLDELGFYQPVHLLGTGNPLSIAVLAAAGADSFDGLEWCRTVADHETGHLHHFQHYDFLSWQTAFAMSPVVREAAQDANVSFAGKAVLHNLDVFETWMQELRESIKTGKVERFLAEKRIPKGSLKQLERALPEVF